jgi:hypothetical protein
MTAVESAASLTTTTTPAQFPPSLKLSRKKKNKPHAFLFLPFRFLSLSFPPHSLPTSRRSGEGVIPSPCSSDTQLPPPAPLSLPTVSPYLLLGREAERWVLGE